LIEPSYISLNSALLFHGVIKQVPRCIECVTARNSIAYDKLGIVYHKIPGGLFFGYKRQSMGKSYIFIAEPEKAVIDGLYLNIYDKSQFSKYIGKADFKKFYREIHNFNGKGNKKLKRVIFGEG